MTKVENELAKMKCNQNEIFWCVKVLASKDIELMLLLSKPNQKNAISAAKRVLMNRPEEHAELMVYIETYQLLEKRLKNCTNFDTLKADNSIAVARINRLNKSVESVKPKLNNVAHCAVFFGAIGNARGDNYPSNRVKFL